MTFFDSSLCHKDDWQIHEFLKFFPSLILNCNPESFFRDNWNFLISNNPLCHSREQKLFFRVFTPWCTKSSERLIEGNFCSILRVCQFIDIHCNLMSFFSIDFSTTNNNISLDQIIMQLSYTPFAILITLSYRSHFMSIKMV